jgi:GNAT superfamily N-acetyltransferase
MATVRRVEVSDDAIDRRARAARATFDDVDPQSDDAGWALQQYFAELDRRFPTGFEAGDALTEDAPALRPPSGVFVVVHVDDSPIACGGARALDERTREIKRMWVHDDWRGAGIGRRLLAHLEHRCSQLGSTRIVLDTNSVLVEAVAMYERAGYHAIPRYNDNPYSAHWFEKLLGPHPT